MLGALLESLLLDAAEFGIFGWLLSLLLDTAEFGPRPILGLVEGGCCSGSGCGCGCILLLTIRADLEGIFRRIPC